MDSGNNAELDLLQQQLQNVSLEENQMEVEPPKKEVEEASSVSTEPPEAQNNVVLDVDQLKLETETKTPEMNKVLLEVELPKIDSEKEKYIQSKLNLTNEKEQKLFALKLQPGYMERKAGITTEIKLANYVKELEDEYEEAKELQAQTDFIINELVEQNFQPEKAVKKFWESEESRAAREIKENDARRQHYIETNRDEVLLNALKYEISHAMVPNIEDIKKLEQEEKAQKVVQPIANKRIFDTVQDLKALSKDKAYDRYYAKPPVQPKKDITNDFPDLEAAIGVHFRYPLLQKELSKKIKPEVLTNSDKQKFAELINKNQDRSDKASAANKDVTDGRVLDGRAKKFRPII